MTSILFLRETIYRNKFGRNYLKNKKLFRNFFCGFSKSALNLKHFQKKHDPQSLFISEITHSGKRG